MAKVPLRVYLREIEDAIDEGQTDEAIAHCRHILKTFPKHIDSYRLLGKAHLEAQKFESAADIFDRVLSALPDDFVAHVGMSIIRENGGNIETAVWHMERAFETQPYNPAIQSEIKRLYGKRDGSEPAKARLTQGALARMYAKGGHYKQAIAELRNTLAQEPNRQDLLVALAEAYALNAQDVEAIQTCSTILRNLPNCLKANRLLAKLLEGTQRQEERKKSLQRLYALDPYEAQVSENALEADEVPDQAVTIERLYWDGTSSVEDASGDPGWPTSPGSQTKKPTTPEAGVPDWLSSASEDETAPDASEGSLFPMGEENDEIPSWMQDAGWEPSSGEFDEKAASLSFDDQDSSEPNEAIEGDIPDWIRNMAPAAGAAAGAAAAANSSDLFPDDDSDSEKIDSIFNQSESDPSSDDSLDWLQDIEIESPSIQLDAEKQPTVEDEGLPERFQTDVDESVLPVDDKDADPLDWLSDVKDDTPAETSSDQGDTEDSGLPNWMQDDLQESEPQAAATDDDPLDWLSDLKDDTPDNVQKQPADAGSDIPDWLQDPEQVSEPAAQESTDDVPDWLKGVDERETGELAGLDSFEPPSQPKQAGGVTEFLQALQTEAEDTYTETDDDEPDWMQEPDIEQASTPTEQPISHSATQDSELPDWLQDTDQDAAPDGAPEETEQETLDWLQDTVQEAPISLQEKPASQKDDIPDWVLSSDEEASLPSEASEESANDIPDWLKATSDEVEESIQEDTPAQPESKIDQVDDLPDFLKATGAATAATTTAAAIDDFVDPSDPDLTPKPGQDRSQEKPVAGDMPDWLQQLEEDTDETVKKVEAQADSEFPDWLDNLTGDEFPDEQVVEPKLEPSLEPSDTPDWLLNAEQEKLEETKEDPKPTMQDRRTAASQALEVADEDEISYPSHQGIQAEIEPEADVEAQAEAEFPEWLTTSETETPTESSTKEDPTFPEWLAEPAQEEKPAQSEAASEFEDADAAMAWLEGLAAKQGVSEEELITSPEDRPDTPPEWAQSETQQTPTEPAKPTDEQKDEEVPDWLSDTAAAAVSLDATTIEPDIAEPEQADADIPDWLSDVSGVEDPDATLVEPAPSEPESAPEFEDADSAMAWLEGLAAKQGVSEDELLSSPDERPDAPPEWVQDSVVDAEAEDIAASSDMEIQAESGGTADSQEEIKPEGQVTEEDVPEWLQEGAFAPPSDADAEPSDSMPVAEAQADVPKPEDIVVEEEDERDTPEWLKDIGPEKTSEPEAEYEAEADVAEADVAEADDSGIQPEEDKVPDWLKEMRAEEETQDPQAPSTSDEDAKWIEGLDDEIEIASEGDYKPGWLDDASADAEIVEQTEQADEEQQLPEWLQDTAIATPPELTHIEEKPDAEVKSEAEDLEEPAIPDDATWVREFGKDVPSYNIEPPQAEIIPADELPGWLQDYDSDEETPSLPVEDAESEPKEAYTWQPSGAKETADGEAQEKLDLNTASLIQMERLPSMGFSRAQVIFSQREEHGPYKNFNELLALPGITPQTLDSIQDYIEIKDAPKAEAETIAKVEAKIEADPIAKTESDIERQPDASGAMEAKPIIPIEDAKDQHHAKQIEAQQKLAEGEVGEAMVHYDKLIKKGKRVDQVIEDLEIANTQQPQSAEILQALGDAYMRADRLQEALDTYSKAEKLLQ